MSSGPLKIPFMRVDRQFENLRPEMMEAVERVLRHGKVLQGPEVSALEKELAALHALPFAVAVNSGTDALILALRAVGVRRGDKVAVTSMSFIASASAIAHAGAVPVFVDVDEYGMARQDRLLELIEGRRVQAVVAVHLYGQMMELEAIRAAAERAGVKIVEDAAQCLGSTRHGRAPGHWSDAVCVSFDPTKVIGAWGSGGAVLTRSEEARERLALLRYHGHAGDGEYREIGYNSQLATVQAAWLLVKLKNLAAWQSRRIAVAEKYTRSLEGNPFISPPRTMSGNLHNFHKYVLRAPGRRDALAAHLAAAGVETKIQYRLPLHEQPCFAGRMETHGSMENVDRMKDEILSLPVYPEITDQEVAQVCESLKSFSPAAAAAGKP